MADIKTCEGYGYPCDYCGASNCPDRRKPPKLSEADILMLYGATEEDIYRGPKED